ncbi:hypothetical protein ONS96_014929 [Cadophora gregata f. sp. sojae]|nr:hypothetical protein ONS96_014929 [Cadophora gregata f. sp. sojae]
MQTGPDGAKQAFYPTAAASPSWHLISRASHQSGVRWLFFTFQSLSRFVAASNRLSVLRCCLLLTLRKWTCITDAMYLLTIAVVGWAASAPQCSSDDVGSIRRASSTALACRS